MAKPQGLVQSSQQLHTQSKQDVTCRPDYQMRHPVRESGLAKGDPIPIHVDKANIPDNIPSDAELWDCVRAILNGHAAGATRLKVDHIKVWLANTVHKEEKEGDIGLGYKWQVFIKMMQAIWEHGAVTKQMRWEIIVLLPKGGSDYCGIGLLEPFWKVMEKVMVA